MLAADQGGPRDGQAALHGPRAERPVLSSVDAVRYPFRRLDALRQRALWRGKRRGKAETARLVPPLVGEDEARLNDLAASRSLALCLDPALAPASQLPLHDSPHRRPSHHPSTSTRAPPSLRLRRLARASSSHLAPRPPTARSLLPSTRQPPGEATVPRSRTIPHHGARAHRRRATPPRAQLLPPSRSTAIPARRRRHACARLSGSCGGQEGLDGDPDGLGAAASGLLSARGEGSALDGSGAGGRPGLACADGCPGRGLRRPSSPMWARSRARRAGGGGTTRRTHTPPTRTARRVRRRARREGGGAEWTLSARRVLWSRFAQQRSTSLPDLFTLTSSSPCPARSSSSTPRSSCASLSCLLDQTCARADPPSTVQVRHLRLRLVPLRACASTLSLSRGASDPPRATLTRAPAPTRTAASSSRRSSTACSAWSTAGTTLPASRSRATTRWSPSSSRRSARCACSRRRP